MSYRSDWHPQDDISQCFAYLIPALTKIGLRVSLFIASHGAICQIDEYLNREDGDYKADANGATPEAAIVEAAYAAIKEKKE